MWAFFYLEICTHKLFLFYNTMKIKIFVHFISWRSQLYFCLSSNPSERKAKANE